MWFLFFFIVIPFILFIGFLVFSIFAIFLINRIFHKKYSQSFSLILPCFSLIFYFMLIMGGISFKSIDPQYYEFKRLCKEAKNVIYDEELYRIYKARYNKERYYDEKTQKEYLMSDFRTIKTHIVKISDKLTINENTIFYQDIPFYKYSSFWYDYAGLFLYGDEAAGFGWETERTLYCKDNIMETRR